MVSPIPADGESKRDRSNGRSAASPWRNGRPPHLPCGRGDLPPAVLFPGDPARVDRFAAILDDFDILGQNREFRVARGTYRGIALGICSTGIGGPSTEIALVEAAQLGCRVALRVGGCGALDPTIALGSFLLVEEAERGGGAAALYADPSQRALANPDLLHSLERSLKREAAPCRRSKVASVDGYYAGQGRPFGVGGIDERAVLDPYRSRNVNALDMEAESILTIGAALGLKAGVLLAVHANRGNDTWLEDYEPTQLQLLRLGCEALVNLDSDRGNSE